MKIVDPNGSTSFMFGTFMDTFVTNIKENFNQYGLVVPSQDAATIANLVPKMVNGTIIYDSTNHNFLGMVNGTLKTFTLT